MIRKYPPILRIPVAGQPRRGHHYMSDADMQKLFSGEGVIEEKLDGSTESFEEYGYIIYAEDMRFVHTVEYTKLPARPYIVIDMLDIDMLDGEKWLSRKEKEDICEECGEFCAPKLYEGDLGGRSGVEMALEYLGTPSAYGAERIEGVVIKNYAAGIMGKIVDPLFETAVDASEHWRSKPRRYNRIIGQRRGENGKEE